MCVCVFVSVCHTCWFTLSPVGEGLDRASVCVCWSNMLCVFVYYGVFVYDVVCTVCPWWILSSL